jgi:ferritin-like metal-binding protein YciE
MKLNSFKNLLIEELRDLFDAEQQLIRALPAMADNAVLPELKAAFVRHLEETRQHLDRLSKVLKALGAEAEGNPCKTMTGLIAEAQDLIDSRKSADPGVLEAALIGAAQKIEHFEIAAYGCARTYAEILGLRAISEILQRTLDEEANTNKILNLLAMQSVNPEAAEATSEDKTLREAVVSVLEVAD